MTAKKRAGSAAMDPRVLAAAAQRIELDGQPRAVLAWEDWNRVLAALEDQADTALVRASRTRIAAGEETLPGEVIAAIYIDGVTPVAAYRKWRGLKQIELAAAAGLKQSYLSEIEAGKKTPSLEVLQTLAAALDLDAGLLLPPRAEG